jgi:hypothetical protein
MDLICFICKDLFTELDQFMVHLKYVHYHHRVFIAVVYRIVQKLFRVIVHFLNI